MRTILISGAASGLGAGFVHAYSQDPNNKIIALDQQVIEPSTAKDRIQTHKLDVTSQESIDAFARSISGTPIDLIIHSAGIRGLVSTSAQQDNVPARETCDIMNLETLTRTFTINAAGAFMLLRAMLPNLRLSSSSSSSSSATNAEAKAKVIILSSRMGSLGNNQPGRRDAGGAYAYRASKAAVNMLTRSLAVDVPEVTWILCHPGRVETNLIPGQREEGAMDVDESLRGLLPLIERWGEEESGRFFDRFGEEIEW